MNKQQVTLLQNLTKDVVAGVSGFKLDAYLLGLEGWRRGLKLKWYKDETDKCTLYKTETTTHGRFFSLGNGVKTHYFYRSRGDLVSNESAIICQDKEKTKTLLEKGNVPVPVGRVFRITEKKEIVQYANEIEYPIIIKPLNGSMGKGVHTNIKSEEELKLVLVDLENNLTYKKYIVEKHYFGEEYRIYVVGDNVIAATNRIPANIVGDGVHTIQDLITEKNKTRKKNPYLMAKPIRIDFEVENSLKRIGYNLSSIPKGGEKIFLRQISNLSAGGDPIDATDELSPEVKQIAVNALKALPQIPHAGVDIIVDPTSSKKGVVLEINATAEIAFHMFPLRGVAREVTSSIIDYYFPETVSLPRSTSFYDYNSVLEPLMSWATEQIEVAPPIFEPLYAKKYIVTGKVKNVGYMTWIKKQALIMNLNGYAKGVRNGKVEIVVYSNEISILQDFLNKCNKGSKKSRVDSVEEITIETEIGKPIRIGFEIISFPASKKQNIKHDNLKKQVGLLPKKGFLQKIKQMLK